jgi:cytochrome P450
MHRQAAVGRTALQDFRLSNGTKIPKGSRVSVSAYSAHMDEANYVHPENFDPFRFSDIRSEDGEDTKHQMVATSPEYLPFGLGRHAW